MGTLPFEMMTAKTGSSTATLLRLPKLYRVRSRACIVCTLHVHSSVHTGAISLTAVHFTGAVRRGPLQAQLSLGRGNSKSPLRD
jgi:hypothetical protein